MKNINKEIMLNIDKIYICHWSKLSNRKEKLIEHLSTLGISDYEWVEVYDKDNWNLIEIVKQYTKIFEADENGRLHKISEISLLLKHCWILKDAYKKYKSVLVLEDDAILTNDFINRFNNYKSQLPEDWDLAWVGTCCGLHAGIVNNQNVYRMNGSRCTHSFIISQKCIEKVVDSIEEFAKYPSDFFYNKLINKFNLNNWWFEPSLAIQNSEFQTTIQNDVNWKISLNKNN